MEGKKQSNFFDFNLVWQSLDNWQSAWLNEKNCSDEKQFLEAISGRSLSNTYNELIGDQLIGNKEVETPVWTSDHSDYESVLPGQIKFFDPRLAQLIRLAAGKANVFVPNFDRPNKVITNNLSTASKNWNEDVLRMRITNQIKVEGKNHYYDKRWRRIESEHPHTENIMNLENSLKLTGSVNSREEQLRAIENLKFDREAQLIRSEAKRIKFGKRGVDYSAWKKNRKLLYGRNPKDTRHTKFERGFTFWLDWLYFLEEGRRKDVEICKFLEVIIQPFRQKTGKICLSDLDMRVYRRRAWDFYNHCTSSDVKFGDYSALRASMTL